MMREFRYKIFNPGGNKTAVVFGNNYSIMKRHVEAEV